MLTITKDVFLNSLLDTYFASFLNKKVLVLKNTSFFDKYFLMPEMIKFFTDSSIIKIRGDIKTKHDLVIFQQFYNSLLLFNETLYFFL